MRKFFILLIVKEKASDEKVNNGIAEILQPLVTVGDVVGVVGAVGERL